MARVRIFSPPPLTRRSLRSRPSLNLPPPEFVSCDDPNIFTPSKTVSPHKDLEHPFLYCEPEILDQDPFADVCDKMVDFRVPDEIVDCRVPGKILDSGVPGEIQELSAPDKIQESEILCIKVENSVSGETQDDAVCDSTTPDIIQADAPQNLPRITEKLPEVKIECSIEVKEEILLPPSPEDSNLIQEESETSADCASNVPDSSTSRSSEIKDTPELFIQNLPEIPPNLILKKSTNRPVSLPKLKTVPFLEQRSGDVKQKLNLVCLRVMKVTKTYPVPKTIKIKQTEKSIPSILQRKDQTKQISSVSTQSTQDQEPSKKSRRKTAHVTRPEDLEITDTPVPDSIFSCPICSFHCKQEVLFSQHMNTHIKITKYNCKLCNINLTSSHLLKEQNSSTLHGKKQCVHINLRPCCDICGKDYINMEAIKSHMLHVHKMGKILQCPQCTYSTTNGMFFANHMRRHTGEKKFQCNFCKRKFTFADSRRRHENSIHTKAMQFPCPFCDYICTVKGALQKHLITHHPKKLDDSNIKPQIKYIGPFECNFCSMIFIHKKGLYAHIVNVHVLYKKFICKLCNFRATQKWILKQHMYVHTNFRKFECDACNSRFKQKDGLRLHIINLHLFQKTGVRGPRGSYKNRSTFEYQRRSKEAKNKINIIE